LRLGRLKIVNLYYLTLTFSLMAATYKLASLAGIALFGGPPGGEILKNFFNCLLSGSWVRILVLVFLRPQNSWFLWEVEHFTGRQGSHFPATTSYIGRTKPSQQQITDGKFRLYH